MDSYLLGVLILDKLKRVSMVRDNPIMLFNTIKYMVDRMFTPSEK